VSKTLKDAKKMKEKVKESRLKPLRPKPKGGHVNLFREAEAENDEP
jgi:hypothetical protein